MSDNQNNNAFSMIADIDGDFTDLMNVDVPNELPILPVRNLVLFPGGRPYSHRARFKHEAHPQG